MAARLRAAVEVPADVEVVWRVLTSPQWPERLDADLRDGSRLVRAEPTPDGGAVLVVSRCLPQGVPGPLQRFLPEDGRVTQTDTWLPAAGGARRGTWSVAFPGAPGQVAGETLVEPDGTGSRWSVTGQVDVRLPLVGRQIEKFLAPLVEKLVARQGEVLRAALAAAT